MGFWPFKKTESGSPRPSNFDHIVWETKSLAIESLVPLVKRFPQYEPIIDSNLLEVWDLLMGIAMTGVAAHARDILSDPKAQSELKISLTASWEHGAEIFDDYYKYTLLRTKEPGAPWSAVSAMWVADNLRLHRRSNEPLKQNAREVGFINPLSVFMNISFGNTEVGLRQFLNRAMPPEIERDKLFGIDMGPGTKGAKKDGAEWIKKIHYLFEIYACKTVDLIAERLNS